MGLEKKKLALFFTCGISLGTWQKAGILAREIKPYNYLAQHFNKIYFITYGGEGELGFKEKLAKNIEILPKRISLPSRLYQFLIPFLYRRELKDTDIYKTNQMGASLPAVLSKWLFKRKLIVRCGFERLKFMERDKKPSWRLWVIPFLERLAYGNADKILVTSLGDRQFVERRFKIPCLQIEVVPNYIDIDLFRPINLEKEKNRICFVGRLSPEKNLFNLIEAISGLNAKLVIFGSGPLREDLEITARKAGAQVELRGNIHNHQLPEELNKSELFILPSLYEGNPKVLLEAMACGLPCIGANIEGIKEIIQHKKNGYLCETDSESIKRAIMKVSEDKSLQEKMGQNARKGILANFSLDKTFAKEKKIYESI